MDAKARLQRRNKKHINKAHRERGKRAYLKQFAYSPQREALKKQRQEEAALRIQTKLASYCQRAETVYTQEEIRALCSEVWQLRHSCSLYLGHVERILKARRAAGELPLY